MTKNEVKSKDVTAVNRKKLYKRILSCWQLYVMLLPTFIYFLVFCYAPMFGIQIAFKNYTFRAGIFGSDWVGLKHFLVFWKSPQFATLLTNTLRITLANLIFGFPFPIILAIIFNECRFKKYRSVIQTLTYAPHFISTVVFCSMILLFLSPTNGVINKFIQLLGGNAIDFMGKSELFVPIMTVSGIWKNCGWGAIIYFAALAGVDQELHEAARIDGANRLQKIWHIDLPSILPTIVILFIMNCGSILSLGYEKIYLLQNSMNLSVSEVISTYVYKVGLLSRQYSYSAAIGLFNSVINITLLIIVNTISKRVSEISMF